MWSIDDIEIYGENPSPRNDMAISAFFYPVSSFGTPESQIASDTFAFEVNLNNNGLNPQTNIVVTAYVKEDGGATLHTQTITIPELAAGVQDSAFLFPGLYAPELASSAKARLWLRMTFLLKKTARNKVIARVLAATGL
jgi:hypothetical protein